MTFATGGRPVTPPPMPLFDAPADDVRQLTVEIDRVLAGRPVATSLQHQLTFAAVPGAGDDSDLWIAQDAKTAGAQAAGDVAEQAASWLGRAKRERRVERARSAVSWTVAVVFVAIIAGASAYVTRGSLPEAVAFEHMLHSFGL
jgi:hypothetical protein